MIRAFALAVAALLPASLCAQTLDWTKYQEEGLRHFQALVQIDSTDPPGRETRVVEYLKKVLDAEGIPSVVAAKDPARANLIARLKGNGSKRPLLIMGHTDTVQVDPAKWSVPPFSATRKDGYVYGRGTLDDKPDVTAALMTMLLLKRMNVPLDRDVIFVAEAGEEANTVPGIQYLVNERWPEIESEFCLAEGGGVRRTGGKVQYAAIQTTEKLPRRAEMIATGPAGHGSRPMRSNAVLHLARAVEKIALWDPPMRLNDTTRTYFEKLSVLSPPAEAEHYRNLLDPQKSTAAREYLAEHDPSKYSMLHTSIAPTMLQAGYQVNVVPSEAKATLDIRALPDEDVAAFYEEMRKVINDPAIKIQPIATNLRPGAPPSRLDTDAYKAVEAAYRKVYNAPAVPQMATGATDMSYLRTKGVQCYGIGAMTDDEDLALGYGAHSDQERILEDAVYKHLEFFWDAVNGIAASRR